MEGFDEEKDLEPAAGSVPGVHRRRAAPVSYTHLDVYKRQGAGPRYSAGPASGGR